MDGRFVTGPRSCVTDALSHVVDAVPIVDFNTGLDRQLRRQGARRCSAGPRTQRLRETNYTFVLHSSAWRT